MCCTMDGFQLGAEESQIKSVLSWNSFSEANVAS